MTGEEMAVKLAETEARSKSNTHRLDHLEKKHGGNKTASRPRSRLWRKSRSTKRRRSRRLKPTSPISPARWRRSKRSRGNRWKTLVEKVILLVTAAVVGCILARWGYEREI